MTPCSTPTAKEGIPYASPGRCTKSSETWSSPKLTCRSCTTLACSPPDTGAHAEGGPAQERDESSATSATIVAERRAAASPMRRTLAERSLGIVLAQQAPALNAGLVEELEEERERAPDAEAVADLAP